MRIRDRDLSHVEGILKSSELIAEIVAKAGVASTTRTATDQPLPT